MMKKLATAKPRLAPEKQQELTSRAQFLEYVTPYEWIPSDIDPDLGEDFLMRIYENGRSTGISFYVQLKSTRDIHEHQLSTGEISYVFEVKDIEHWDAQTTPVLVVIWDISLKSGWYMILTDMVKDLKKSRKDWRHQKTVNVVIPFTNGLDQNGIETVRNELAIKLYPLIAKDREMEVHVTLGFPKTEEGITKYASLQRSIDAGDPVEIEGKYINDLHMSEWFERLMGPMVPEGTTLYITTFKSDTIIPVSIDFESVQYGTERIPYVELKIEKGGAVEVTLSNHHQSIPAKFLFVIRKDNGMINLKFRLDLDGVDAVTIRQSVMIKQILSSGGVIYMNFINSGVSSELPISEAIIDPVDPVFLDFINDLVMIQIYTKQKFVITGEMPYTKKDLLSAKELVSIFKTGKFHGEHLVFSLDIEKPAITRMLQFHNEGALIHMRIQSPSSYFELLELRFDLGPMTRNIIGRLDNTNGKIDKWLSSASDNDVFRVNLLDVTIDEEIQALPAGIHLHQ